MAETASTAAADVFMESLLETRLGRGGAIWSAATITPFKTTGPMYSVFTRPSATACFAKPVSLASSGECLCLKHSDAQIGSMSYARPMYSTLYAWASVFTCELALNNGAVFAVPTPSRS